MADVVIRVGAALDANPDTLFEPLVKASAKAAALIKKNFEGATAGLSVAGSGGSSGARPRAPQQSGMSDLEAAVKRVSDRHKRAMLDAHAEAMTGIAEEKRLLKERAKALRDSLKDTGAVGGTPGQGPYRTRANTGGNAKLREELEYVKKIGAAREHQKRLQDMSQQEMVAHYRQMFALEDRKSAAKSTARPTKGVRDDLSTMGRGALSSMGGRLADVGLRGASYGAKLPMDVAKAAGFDFDLSSGVGKSVKLESTLANLSNSAYIPSENKGYQSPEKIMERVKPVANKVGIEFQEAADAMVKFTEKTGDLEGGLAMLDSMARVSVATGTNLDHMAGAMADVSIALGDMPDKAKAMEGIMAALAGQGQVGAIEIKDLADKMGKLTAVAPHFEVKGGVASAIKMTGGMAQIIRRQGGKTTASEVATSIGALFETFNKTAREKGFANMGIRTHEKSGKIRDPRELLTEALEKTAVGGLDKQANKMNALVADQRAKPLSTAMMTIFQDAYNAKQRDGDTLGVKATEREKIEAGKAAVQAEFKRMDDVAMSAAQIEGAFNKAANTTERQANRMANDMTEVGNSLKTAIVPHLIALGPHLKNFGMHLSGAYKDLSKALEGLRLGLDPKGHELGTMGDGSADFTRFGTLMKSMEEGKFGEVDRAELQRITSNAMARASLRAQAVEGTQEHGDYLMKMMRGAVKGSGQMTDEEVYNKAKTAGGKLADYAGAYEPHLENKQSYERADRFSKQAHALMSRYDATVSSPGIAPAWQGPIQSAVAPPGWQGPIQPPEASEAKPPPPAKVDSADMNSLGTKIREGAFQGIMQGLSAAGPGLVNPSGRTK